ncbi:hypothetical protein H4Q26_014664 [Puccinia striiformis f. sp. tritici PST-130]|nr:hypothetical protein H4Q26_014664 [Puccinia striiformis f. sp. tritici PST-130]
MSKTTESVQMEKTNSVIFVTLIKAIPLLADENFSTWKSKILTVFEYLAVKDVFTKGEGKLSSELELVLRMLILAKLEERVYDRVVNPENEGDIMLIWKSVIVEFASNEAANQERVWNEFSNLPFDNSDVQGHIKFLDYPSPSAIPDDDLDFLDCESSSDTEDEVHLPRRSKTQKFISHQIAGVLNVTSDTLVKFQPQLRNLTVSLLYRFNRRHRQRTHINHLINDQPLDGFRSIIQYHHQNQSTLSCSPQDRQFSSPICSLFSISSLLISSFSRALSCLSESLCSLSGKSSF